MKQPSTTPRTSFFPIFSVFSITAPSLLASSSLVVLATMTGLTVISPSASAQPNIASFISHSTKSVPPAATLVNQQSFLDTNDPHLVTNAWIPVGRIDPTQPATLILVNDTTIPLEYSFSTTIAAPQELAPNDKISLSDVSIPSTLLINAFTSAAVLDFAFSPAPTTNAPNNTVTVTISLVNQQYDAVGFTAIDVDTTGALYRY